MSTITIEMSDDRLAMLRERARQANVPAEELARAGLEDWLRAPREDFAAAAAYVLRKNAELYRRLA
jgi:antitoxin FitA